VQLYRDAARQAGRDPATLAVGLNVHGFVAPTSAEAADRFFPPYAEVMTRIGAERGWPPVTRVQFELSRSPRGALAVGTPAEMVEKILAWHRIFGHQRTLIQLGVGPLAHEHVMRAIELLGSEVAPAVRSALGVRMASN